MLIAGLALAFCVLAGSFILVLIKDQTYSHSLPNERGQEGSADILVVYYSRSGKTEVLARTIGRKF